jgi:A/G-specific adenine glycosylase
MKAKREKDGLKNFRFGSKQLSVLKGDNGLSQRKIAAFRREIYDYYNKFGRDLPWRKTRDPYHILVSEIMLQQTQVDRVIMKFKEFISVFPDIASLRRASLAQIYSIWQGLGYNRRALALKKIADTITTDWGGRFPDTFEQLLSLPGIGAATASSISAFAFNTPTVFIETNIRAVFIYRFFRQKQFVDDSEIAVLVETMLDKKKPCQWYSALMDYGAMLKKKYPELTKKSAHYKKQSLFKGSRRQLRGNILKFLLQCPQSTEKILMKNIGNNNVDILNEILNELTQEGLIKLAKGRFSIL